MKSEFASVPGLDPSQFRAQQQYQREDEANHLLGVSLQLTDEERYKDCENFTFTCPQCGKDNICDSVFEGTVSGRLNVIILTVDCQRCTADLSGHFSQQEKMFDLKNI